MSKKVKWRDSDVILFLEYYKQLPCLWNTKIEDYKDRFKRKKAYETLRANMEMDNLTILDVKNKIKGIRTTYSDELSKITHSQKTGSEEIYVPKVFWFKLADTFLRGVTERRKQSNSRDSVEVSSFFQDEGPDHTDESYSEDISQWSIKSKRHIKHAKRSFSETTVFANEKDDIKVESPTRIKNKNPKLEEDEFDLFGRSIAMQLKKLPEIDALQLMHKMQSMVICKKMELGNSKQSSKESYNIYLTSPDVKATTTMRVDTSTNDPLNYNCYGPGISSSANENVYCTKFERDGSPDSLQDSQELNETATSTKRF